MSHRYAAILAADVAHYSTLMEGDGEGTVQALKDCRVVFRRCVSAHHGREFGSVGDSLMAEFSSPVEALRAAHCIHSELEHNVASLTDGDRLQVRIGLHAGDVISDGDDIFGDVVNTASRIQQLAQPGSTTVSDSFHAQVGKEAGQAFRSLGKHSLRNIADPVRVFEAERHHRLVNWRRLRLAVRPYRSALAAVLGVTAISLLLVIYLESGAPRIGGTIEVAPTDIEQDKTVLERGDPPSALPTDNFRAYQLFVEGRQLFHQRGPAVGSAIAALQRAVELDPEFVDAWAYLGAAASVAWGYDTGLSLQETTAIAEEATQRALELDSNFGLALAVSGNLAVDRGELSKAAKYFDHAVLADPGNSSVLMWAGVFYLCNGLLEDALRAFERAYELDPAKGITNSYLGMTHLALGQSELAQPYLTRAEEQAFFHHAATWFNHMVYAGEINKALDYRERFTSGESEPTAAATRLAVAEALRSGDTKEVERLADEGATVNRLPGNWNMSLYLVLDLEDRFFDVFSRTVIENPYWRATMRFFWLPGNRKYIEHPRFFSSMREAGVVELWDSRGYPDGCVKVVDAIAEHLSCGSRLLQGDPLLNQSEL